MYILVYHRLLVSTFVYKEIYIIINYMGLRIVLLFAGEPYRGNML